MLCVYRLAPCCWTAPAVPRTARTRQRTSEHSLTFPLHCPRRGVGCPPVGESHIMSDRPKHPGGAPSKFTEELGQRICAAVAEGGHIRFACEANGVAYYTVRKWLTSRQPKFAQFIESFARARAAAARHAEACWRAAFEHDWRAAASWLARCFPEEYGKPAAPAAPALFDPRAQRAALQSGELFESESN